MAANKVLTTIESWAKGRSAFSQNPSTGTLVIFLESDMVSCKRPQALAVEKVQRHPAFKEELMREAAWGSPALLELPIYALASAAPCGAS